MLKVAKTFGVLTLIFGVVGILANNGYIAFGASIAAVLCGASCLVLWIVYTVKKSNRKA